MKTVSILTLQLWGHGQGRMAFIKVFKKTLHLWLQRLKNEGSTFLKLLCRILGGL